MKKTDFTEYQRMAFASEAHFKSIPYEKQKETLDGKIPSKTQQSESTADNSLIVPSIGVK